MYADQGGSVVATMIALIILSTSFLLLRILSRRVAGAGYWVRIVMIVFSVNQRCLRLMSNSGTISCQLWHRYDDFLTHVARTALLTRLAAFRSCSTNLQHHSCQTLWLRKAYLGPRNIFRKRHSADVSAALGVSNLLLLGDGDDQAFHVRRQELPEYAVCKQWLLIWVAVLHSIDVYFAFQNSKESWPC